MPKFILSLMFLGLILTFSNSFSHENNPSKEEDKLLFEKIFTEWTQAFNRKDLKKTCDLFSKDLTATYKGTTQKNYDSVCEKFKKLFSQDKQYQYRFEIHQVYHSLDLAAIRITWYLTVDEPGKKTALIEEEGMDILKPDADGQWKIINFLGY